jgi:hypothetical protein
MACQSEDNISRLAMSVLQSLHACVLLQPDLWPHDHISLVNNYFITTQYYNTIPRSDPPQRRRSSTSLLLLELVWVLGTPSLRLQGLRRRRLGNHARLAQQPANRLRWLRAHCQPVPAAQASM